MEDKLATKEEKKPEYSDESQTEPIILTDALHPEDIEFEPKQHQPVDAPIAL